jgi:hypothetical protein
MATPPLEPVTLMHPTTTNFLVHERIADLMRVSADIHRGPEGATVASRLVGALAAPLSPIAGRLEAVASTIATAVGSRRPAAGT